LIVDDRCQLAVAHAAECRRARKRRGTSKHTRDATMKRVAVIAARK
jgi:hypothetical protein